ncbi:MAG: SDR family oxidoreductase [Burkholderiales bacterium]
MDFKGKVVLITGGSGDIGSGIAAGFKRRGAHVAIASSSQAKLDRASAALRDIGGGEVLASRHDLKQPNAAQELVQEVVERFGRLDVLINCAGNFKRGSLISLTNDDWVDGFNLMFFGAVRVTKAAWPHLIKSKGNVVTVSGIHGVTPHAGSAIGGTICAALINFNKATAELGLADGVRVNCVVPGWIESWRLDTRVEAIAQDRGITNESAKQAMQDELEIIRYGTPADVAELVAFVASDRAGYIHGQAYILDGGLTKSI